MRRRILSSTLCPALVLVPTPSQERWRESLEEQVVAVIESAVEEKGIAGLSLSIAVGPEIFLEGGWGHVEPGEPATAESRYRAGSLTCQLTAVALLRLVEAEKLGLDDDIGRFFPQAGGTDDEWSETEITVCDLLDHTSGLRDFGLQFNGSTQERTFTPERAVAWVFEQPREAEPVTCFAYTRTNTLLAGRIVEQLAEVELPRFFERELFHPLRMTSTLYCYDAPTIHEFADASQEIGGALVYEEPEVRLFAAEGLCTSARDLQRLLRGVIDGEVLSDFSFEDLAASRVLKDGTRTSYGLGWNLVPLNEEPCFSFGGGMAGSRLHAAYYPRLDLRIAILASSDSAPVDRIERRIARLFHRIPEPGVQDVPLEQEERARFLGGYYEGCNRLDVTEKGDHLYLLYPLHDDEPIRLLYQGLERFVAADDPDFRLTFELEDGVSRALVLTIHGVARRAVRVE